MYSYQLIGAPKYKCLMSQHMYLSPGVEMVLLMMSLAMVMSAVGVLKSPAFKKKSSHCRSHSMRLLFLWPIIHYGVVIRNIINYILRHLFFYLKTMVSVPPT